MVDFHSHILPCIDDGSESAAESIKLLHMLSSQGIKRVCATPHFSANRHSVKEFLELRQQSLQKISECCDFSQPIIHCGAEVSYYDGISRLDNLKSLCIEGTDILLIEMPFSKWTDYTIDEVIHLACSGGIRILLAHIERYLSYQKLDVFDQLIDGDVLMQVNASFFTQFSTKRKALKMLKNGYINMIGSDCHNTTARPPNIGDAFDVVEKKMGTEYLNDMQRYWNHFFQNK